mmetsp:Transcript_15037/g.40330  ORF Transcript_15037/g.40330 Transcript_15037/m.40330 type:complete len:443 (+) Transcript_15037:539-1867(+)
MMGPRVAVIGGGAAGLCAARNLLAGGARAVVFEQAADVGGTWDIENPDSSMYYSLRTNLPAPVMQFPDFQFESTYSFPTHAEVCDYLRKYAARFDLRAHLRLSSRVTRARYAAAKCKWTVEFTRGSNAGHQSEEFDAVVVCNGHFAHPKGLTSVVGLSGFAGLVMHSHDYRTPGQLDSVRRVVILGAGNSGIDISLELAQKYPAAEFILSHRSYQAPQESATAGIGGQYEGISNLLQRHAISHVSGPAAVVFEDGTAAENVDAILLCTGYEYRFPFLTRAEDDMETPEVRLQDNVVQDLYMHVFHVDNPSLCFVGLPSKVAPFPQFHFQTQWITAVLCGTRTLPNSAEMKAWCLRDREERKARGEPARYGHVLGDLQWEYNRRLCDAAGAPHDVPVRKSMYVDCGRARREDAIGYRRRQYLQLGPGESQWRVLLDGVDITPP